MSTSSHTTFKRLAVGQRFISHHNGTKGLTFRKASERGAFRLLIEDKLRPGRGQTHAEVSFTRSTVVAIV